MANASINWAAIDSDPRFQRLHAKKTAFLMGLIGPDKPFPDSAKTELAVTLGFRWQRYFIDLRGLDLSRIKTGFGWIVAGQAEPVTFYLDDIGYE